ncbi:hypothetical protein TWF506_008282 [Arthrobotrys conoides]|uniref:Uncharacterized protein n=1 Tax=Arthrobotrys conoides TaxID=74498 RepID=A0AAN8NLI5_9PEZI
MHRPILIALLTLTALTTALPQTRSPGQSPSPTSNALLTTRTPTPFLSTPPKQKEQKEESEKEKEVIHNIIDTITCTDPSSGTTTIYESHDIDVDSIPSPSSSQNKKKKKLVKRGNCLPRTQQQYLDYYEDPPSLDQMIRPAGAPVGTHYSESLGGNYRGGSAGMRSRGSLMENLMAEASVEGSIVGGGDDDNYNFGGGIDVGGGGQEEDEEDEEEDNDFDMRMDEFESRGLEMDALPFERGILDVPGGVGGGVNRGFGRGRGGGRGMTMAGRFGDVVRDALEKYAAGEEEDEEEEEEEEVSDLQRAHSRPEEPNPINLDDSQYSVIDEDTIDAMRRGVVEQLAGGYENILAGDGSGNGGGGGGNGVEGGLNLEGLPDTTDVPVQSGLTATGQESSGEETGRLAWGGGRAVMPGFGWLG